MLASSKTWLNDATNVNHDLPYWRPAWHQCLFYPIIFKHILGWNSTSRASLNLPICTMNFTLFKKSVITRLNQISFYVKWSAFRAIVILSPKTKNLWKLPTIASPISASVQPVSSYRSTYNKYILQGKTCSCKSSGEQHLSSLHSYHYPFVLSIAQFKIAILLIRGHLR